MGRRSTGLISIDASGPVAADVPPDARLVDAPHLQAIHEPSPRLDLVPRHILQQGRVRGWAERVRRSAGLGAGAVLVHAVLGGAFVYLLSFRDAEAPREVEIPVEIVHEAPKPSGAEGSRGAVAGGPSGPKADPAKPDVPAGPPPSPAKPPAPRQDAKLAAAMALPPAATAPLAPRPPAAPQGETAPPKLTTPPEAAKSATQDRDNKPANLVPDEHQADQATREARPVAVPEVLTTGDARAETAVPAPVKPPPVPAARPTPPIPAKAPSTADKLAAALPMDSDAMPLSFRSVLAGNASAQLNAAYSGVVQGRIRQAQAELAQTAYAERLKGSIAVTFTIDDAGRLTNLAVVQSSGNARLDALALHAIQLAAPFPPPPPEAEHTFNKAFIVGG